MLDRTAVDEISASYHVEKLLSPRDNSYLRASGISSCRRQLAYRLLWHKENKPELPIWSHGLFTFDLGHGIHYRLQSRLSNVGPLKWVDAEPYINGAGFLEWHGNCEIPLVNHEYKVAGHCDALTKPLKKIKRTIEGKEIELYEVAEEDDPEARRYIIDIKSITARERLKVEHDPNSGYIRNATVLPSAFEKLTAPKDDHIGQVSIYSWMTTQPGFHTDRLTEPLKELPGLMIIYVAKDLDPNFYGKNSDDYAAPKDLLNSPYKVFTLDTNPKILPVLLKKASLIWKHMEEGTLPPRDYNHKPERPAYACVDCPFRKECYAEEAYFENDNIEIPPIISHRSSLINKELITLG